MPVKSNLFEAVKNSTNKTHTTNGLPANKSTLSACVDLFAKGASFRRNPKMIRQLVREAYHEDKLICTRILFYFRDIRGNSGQGERAIFREALKELIELDANHVKNVLKFIPEYGRWDDLINLWGISSATNKIIGETIEDQLKKDLVALESGQVEKISLLAKWMPSSNTSSAKTKFLAKEIRTKVFGINEKIYRKTLSLLRKVLNLVETNLSQKNYSFDYSKLPGKAILQYRKAFLRNDEVRYKKYLDALNVAVRSGDTSVKVNASTVYPYELVEKCWRASTQEKSLCDSMWRSLKDYFNGNTANWLALADVSGSMSGRPMAVSVSLATYIAERNHGIFKNKYITYSNNPRLIEIDPEWPLDKKIDYVMHEDVGYNTNLIKVFDVILNAAVENRLEEGDMPEALVIISDMQFDSHQMSGQDDRSIDIIKRKYAEAGYKLPKIVYWNVAQEDYGNVPVTVRDENTILVNGCKPGMFDMILQGANPLDFVLRVVNSERYSQIIF